MKLKNRHIITITITLVLVGLFLIIEKRYLIIHNKSISLNARWFVVSKGQLPTKGQVFAFTVPTPNDYEPGEIFIKIAGGVVGDEIIIKERDFYINNQLIGTAKTTSLKGLPLTISSAGVIPDHHYFAYTTHKDSYDSRYQEIGLIDEAQIIGTAVFSF